VLNTGEMLAWQVVEQREMRRDDVPLGWKVAASLRVEEGEGAFVELEREDERRGRVHAMKNPARGRVVSASEVQSRLGFS
jgi:hypothetical protein